MLNAPTRRLRCGASAPPRGTRSRASAPGSIGRGRSFGYSSTCSCGRAPSVFWCSRLPRRIASVRGVFVQSCRWLPFESEWEPFGWYVLVLHSSSTPRMALTPVFHPACLPWMALCRLEIVFMRLPRSRLALPERALPIQQQCVRCIRIVRVRHRDKMPREQCQRYNIKLQVRKEGVARLSRLARFHAGELAVRRGGWQGAAQQPAAS